MSRMRTSYLKPPLPKSPLRLRSRQVLSNSSSSSILRTPPGLAKFQKRNAADLESNLPVEYSSISSEIHAMAKMVEKEFAQEEVKSRASSLEHMAANSEVAPVFERGRFYDEYSARRNERLRRKKGEDTVVKGTPYNLGVEPMTTKRRGTVKKKTTMVEMTATAPRYSLRSMKKENKKPPVPLNVDVSAMKTVTATTRRGRRI
ncbi:uncharacterized protein LOC103856373 [Brassica rapa]|uniref:Uncharacterized protein n=2 Tax=Brassica TaxID=3705 RepID=A0A3P5ZG73_BRACM|nr:uncharacterized protein LOC103856373 [Brassica rapa]XP_013740233.1 uncharacterized protein BNAA03G07530D [Brassica napus]KAH0931761.1 hypothetical protein HID58_008878 [Brassica napus]CAF2120352.1 unnamed protein product [Brassica napus]CAG7879593.1 unnamed protein product [Brassica rapa]VDC79042.1 unnamed protein product [Brassica rapa]